MCKTSIIKTTNTTKRKKHNNNRYIRRKREGEGNRKHIQTKSWQEFPKPTEITGSSNPRMKENTQIS